MQETLACQGDPPFAAVASGELKILHVLAPRTQLFPVIPEVVFELPPLRHGAVERAVWQLDRPRGVGMEGEKQSESFLWEMKKRTKKLVLDEQLVGGRVDDQGIWGPLPTHSKRQRSAQALVGEELELGISPFAVHHGLHQEVSLQAADDDDVARWDVDAGDASHAERLPRHAVPARCGHRSCTQQHTLILAFTHSNCHGSRDSEGHAVAP